MQGGSGMVMDASRKERGWRRLIYAQTESACFNVINVFAFACQLTCSSVDGGVNNKWSYQWNQSCRCTAVDCVGLLGPRRASVQCLTLRTANLEAGSRQQSGLPTNAARSAGVSAG